MQWHPGQRMAQEAGREVTGSSGIPESAPGPDGRSGQQGGRSWHIGEGAEGGGCS